MNTKDDKFWITSKDKVKAPFMFQQIDIDYMENGNLQAVILPYRGNDVSMIILLPKKIDGLNEIERLLSAETLGSWLPQFHKTNTNVYLPKFKVSFKAQLAKTLKSMGMTNAFSNAADFSGIDGTKDLFISAVIHKAFIDVNEEGTEAAAATAVKMTMKAEKKYPEGPPKEFRADHPFILLIQERHSGNILFMGRVNRPQSSTR
jgi:serpin B